MASISVDTKIINGLFVGAAALPLNPANAPWLSNVIKIIRPSLSSGINTRQSYNGAYGGATPGGAVSALTPGLIYEITSGLTNGWTLPDFTRLPVDPAANAVRLVAHFAAGQTALAFPLKITGADQPGTYNLDPNNPLSGLTGISYAKAGAGVTLPVALALNDTLTITGTTASGVDGLLTLIKQ